MNEIIESLLSRRSVRVFEERAIPAAEKEAILLAAVNAPTAGNQQLYTILDVTDPELKARLAESCDHQPFIAKAPLVLIFCADCQKWYDAFLSGGCAPRLPGAGDLLLAVDDSLIAAQNAVTAAWSLGVGSCYIGDVMERCEEHPGAARPAGLCLPGGDGGVRLSDRRAEGPQKTGTVRDGADRAGEPLPPDGGGRAAGDARPEIGRGRL